MFVSSVLKYGPEPIASVSEPMNFDAVMIEYARSSLCLASTSVMICSWPSTLVRFGLSLTNPENCCDTAETFCSSTSTAWLRSLTAASSTCALTNSRLICSLRLPSTAATLLDWLSSSLN